MPNYRPFSEVELKLHFPLFYMTAIGLLLLLPFFIIPIAGPGCQQQCKPRSSGTAEKQIHAKYKVVKDE